MHAFSATHQYHFSRTFLYNYKKIFHIETTLLTLFSSYSEDREEPSSQSDESKPKILLMGLRR